MTYHFIINDSAGRGNALRHESLIEGAMKARDLEYRMVRTIGAAEAIEYVATKLSTDDIAVAVGGDGTVRSVVEGLLRSGVGALGILPLGTANDFYLNSEAPKDFEGALDGVLYGKEHLIDCGLADDVPFLNIATIGYDALVVEEAQKWRRFLPGVLSYYLGLISGLMRYKAPEVVYGGEAKRLFLFAVGNGGYYGGGFNILPMAKIDDGQLDGCLISNISKRRVIQLFPTILSGKHVNQKSYVAIHQAKHHTITIGEPFVLNLDGELVSVASGKTVEFRVVQKAIRLIY